MAKTKTNEEKKIEALKTTINCLVEDHRALAKRVADIESKAEVYEQALDWIGVVKSFWEIASSMAKTQRLTRDK